MGCCCCSSLCKSSEEIDEIPMYIIDFNKELKYQKDIFPYHKIYEMNCISMFDNSQKCNLIMEEPDLYGYLISCSKFFDSLENLNGPIGNRDTFYNFLLIGKVWMVHYCHYETCNKTHLGSFYSRKGLGLWYCTLVKIYLHNMFDPDKSIGIHSEIFKKIIKTIPIKPKEKNLPITKTYENFINFPDVPETTIDSDDDDNNNINSNGNNNEPLVNNQMKQEKGYLKKLISESE